MRHPELSDAAGEQRRPPPLVPDAEELGKLLQQYWHPLVAYVSRLLGDTAAAEDVVQHAFVRVWERGHAVPQGEQARPFLYRIVRNLAANEWRRQETQRSWMDQEIPLDASISMPSQRVEEDELAAALVAAVERLPGRRREIFVLSRYHALTNREIGDVLSIAPQTVANQLVSALRELRALLEPHLETRHAPELRIVRREDRAVG